MNLTRVSEDKASGKSAAQAFLSAGLLVFGSSMVLSIGGFAFHALASRRLGVEDYGALYAIISVYSLAIIPASLFMPVVAKYAAEFRALHDDGHVRGLIDFILRTFGIAGAAYVAFSMVFAAPSATFLHVATWEVPLIGFIAATGIVSGMLRALGQGLHDYTSLAMSMSGEGIGKFIVLAALSLGGLTVFRGTSAFLAGMLIGLVLMAAPLVLRYASVPSSPIVLDWRRIFATTAGAASITFTAAVMGFADVVIVKHFFGATDAGLYSAASLSGKILLYFVGFVPAILIPQATYRHARGERTRQTLLLAVVFVSAVSACGVAAYWFGGTLLLHALVGREFDAAAVLLPRYAGAMALLAVTNALASYGIATHRLAFITPLLVGTVATLAAMLVVHPALSVVVDELLAGNAAMLAGVGIALGVQGARGART